MKRRFLSVGLILACSSFALAQDEKVLGKDDYDFARALVQGGYPDLAQRLLAVIEKKSGGAGEAKAQIEQIRIDVAQDEGRKLEDPMKRKDALIKVLRDKEKFIESSKGKQAAEDTRDGLSDLYDLIGSAFGACIKKEKDEKVLDTLRTEGDGIFIQAEQTVQKRIDEIKAIDPKSDDDKAKQMAAEYNHCRLLYFHALLYSTGSSRRAELCNKSITEFDEFFLNWETNESPLMIYYAMVDYGNCLREVAKPEEAISAGYDRAIALRQSYGDPDKNGRWPIPSTAKDIEDLVCYAMLQKMYVLRDSKKADKAAEVGKDYMNSMPRPFEPGQSMLLAKELAENQKAVGDSAGVTKTAKAMLAEDPAGIGGVWAREILGDTGGGVAYTEKLKNAQAKLASNPPEFERALTICRQVLVEVTGTADEQKGGCEAMVLIGYAYQKRGWMEEAALAYDTAVEKYPGAEGAPEACALAIACYTSANSAGRRKHNRENSDRLTNLLTSRWPNAKEAGGLIMMKAKQLESDGDLAGAVAIYEKVDVKSSDFTKARLLMGIDYFNWAQKLVGEKKVDEGKALFAKAEQAFKDSVQAIQQRRAPGPDQTFDPVVLAALDEQEYAATFSLAKLYMNENVARLKDALAVVESLEKNSKWTSDATKGPSIQNLRGSLFLSQGQFDQAQAWVDDLYKRDPKAAASPAGLLAREFDVQGAEKRKTNANSVEADELWRKAAKYYYISIKPQVDGVVTQNAETMTSVGDRFFVYGLTFNKVPESSPSFIDWVPGPIKAFDYWVKAAQIYEAALTQTPDYRMTIKLGRTYGFLGKPVDAARVYAKLFEQEQIIGKDKRKLDPAVMKKGELVYAYLEYGVAERLAFGVDQDKTRLQRCRDVILTPLCNTLKPDTSAQAYWGSMYHMIKTLMDLGAYSDADLKIKDLQRQVSPTFDDGKFGYKPLFEAVAEEVKGKLFNNK